VQGSFIGIVYLITNLLNGKRYVGCSKVTLKQRWWRHRSSAKKGSPLALHAAIRKYGAERFTVETLEEVSGTHADLMAAEIRQIAFHNSIAPNGYNLTMGGDGVDYQVPGVYERMVEGARKRSANPEWLRNTADAARRRAADPEWRGINAAACQRRAADPEWLANNAEMLRERQDDAAYQLAHAEAMRQRSTRTEWQQAHAGRMLSRNIHNVEWRVVVKANISKGRAVMAAKVLERDSHLSPDELRRLIHKREQARGYRAAKKEGHAV